MTAYMTLFTADLVQDSGLLIGGSADADSGIDDVFCRDGLGRLTMRGRGLKGALVATTRKLYMTVPESISGVETLYARARSNHTEAQSREVTESLWTVHTSHPANSTVRLEYRESVGLRQDTQARAEGVLRDLEATARGTTWPLLLEVRTWGQDGAVAERLAAATLREWARGRVWLGKDVARGLGWMIVKDLRALRLPVSRARDWPDATMANPIDAARDLAPVGQWIKAEDFPTNFGIEVAESDWRYVEVTARLRTGPRDDGYGVEALAVAGIMPMEPVEGRAGTWLLPRSAKTNVDIAARSTTAPFAESPPGTGKAIVAPVIGGGSLRGAARQELSRAARMAGRSIRDPNVDTRDPADPLDSIEASFGTLESSAALLVRDANVADPAGVAWAVVQHHAEDQFVGGVFEGAKFDRGAVFLGEFDVRIVLETKDATVEDRFLAEQLPTLIQLGKGGFLALGAGKTRGYGGAPWRDVRVRRARAGEDWQDVGEVGA